MQLRCNRDNWFSCGVFDIPGGHEPGPFHWRLREFLQACAWLWFCNFMHRKGWNLFGPEDIASMQSDKQTELAISVDDRMTGHHALTGLRSIGWEQVICTPNLSWLMLECCVATNGKPDAFSPNVPFFLCARVELIYWLSAVSLCVWSVGLSAMARLDLLPCACPHEHLISGQECYLTWMCCFFHPKKDETKTESLMLTSSFLKFDWGLFRLQFR